MQLLGARLPARLELPSNRRDAYPVGSAAHNILWVGRGCHAVRPNGGGTAATNARQWSRWAEPAAGTPRGDGEATAAALLGREAALELGQRAREVGSGHGANI